MRKTTPPSSLGEGSREYLGAVLSEVSSEQLSQVQEGWPRRQRHTLNETLLVEDEEIRGTRQYSPSPLPGSEDTPTRLGVGDKVLDQVGQVSGTSQTGFG